MNNFQLVSNFDSKYCNSKVRTEKKMKVKEMKEKNKEVSNKTLSLSNIAFIMKIFMNYLVHMS